MEEKQLIEWNLNKSSNSYRILTRESGVEAVNLDDESNYREAIDSFHKMGFSEEYIKEIFKIVGAILHLGTFYCII
jgi:myosin heavy subunit